MASSPVPASDVVRFGDFTLDLRAGEIWRDGGNRVLLPHQGFRLLAVLVRSPGTLVTREDLRHELWADDTFVDFEHGLNSAIKRLREALGESATAPRYIETLPRRGYRFIAPVVPLNGRDTSAARLRRRRLLLHFRSSRPRRSRRPSHRTSGMRFGGLPMAWP
jgi:DNA-binding winged helix-turn-helix (wHTH) protein